MTGRRGHLSDIDYFRRRALEEQAAAAKAASAPARGSHDELAMLYRLKAAMLSTGPVSWAGSAHPVLVPDTL